MRAHVCVIEPACHVQVVPRSRKHFCRSCSRLPESFDVSHTHSLTARMHTERGPRVNVTVGVHSSCRVSTTVTDLSVPTVDSERSNTWCQQRLACNSSERTCSASLSETRPDTASATFRNSRNSARCAPSAAFAGNISYSYVSGGRVLSGARVTASRLSCKPGFHSCSNGDM